MLQPRKRTGYGVGNGNAAKKVAGGKGARPLPRPVLGRAVNTPAVASSTFLPTKRKNAVKQQQVDDVDPEFDEPIEDDFEAPLEQQSQSAPKGDLDELIQIPEGPGMTDEIFIGVMKIHKGRDKYFIHCQEVLDRFEMDAKVTWRSKCPAGLRVGDWVQFEVAPGFPYAGPNDWGSPLAIFIEGTERPDGVELPWEEEGFDGWAPDLTSEPTKDPSFYEFTAKWKPEEPIDRPPDPKIIQRAANKAAAYRQRALRAASSAPAARSSYGQGDSDALVSAMVNRAAARATYGQRDPAQAAPVTARATYGQRGPAQAAPANVCGRGRQPFAVAKAGAVYGRVPPGKGAKGVSKGVGKGKPGKSAFANANAWPVKPNIAKSGAKGVSKGVGKGKPGKSAFANANAWPVKPNIAMSGAAKGRARGLKLEEPDDVAQLMEDEEHWRNVEAGETEPAENEDEFQSLLAETEQGAELEEEGEEELEGDLPDELGERYIGCIKSHAGQNRYFIDCAEIAEAFEGKDAMITPKSNAPKDLSVGEWVSFAVVLDDTAMGRALAVAVEPADPPDVVEF